VNVVVHNPDGQIATASSAFTYQSPPAPTISDVSPASGTANGGTAITITGTNFAAGATVSFGGVMATSVQVTSATTITLKSPAHAAGAVTVSVTNLDGQGATLPNGYTYNAAPAPTLSGITPASGSSLGGTGFSISGTNLAAGATVSLGGVAATAVNVVSASFLTATSGVHAPGMVNVVVTNPDGQMATISSGYTYTPGPAPTIASIAPTSGPAAGGTMVTITGSNFVSGATVSLGGVAATSVTVVSATSITATSGAHAGGAADVVVTNPDSQAATLSAGFTYDVTWDMAIVPNLDLATDDLAQPPADLATSGPEDLSAADAGNGKQDGGCSMAASHVPLDGCALIVVVFFFLLRRRAKSPTTVR
jgi:hypothetical protein